MVVHLEPDDLVGKISCRCEVFKLSKLQSLPRNKMLICHIIYVVSLCVCLCYCLVILFCHSSEFVYKELLLA